MLVRQRRRFLRKSLNLSRANRARSPADRQQIARPEVILCCTNDFSAPRGVGKVEFESWRKVIAAAHIGPG
jgi:hypothetical protein